MDDCLKNTTDEQCAKQASQRLGCQDSNICSPSLSRYMAPKHNKGGNCNVPPAILNMIIAKTKQNKTKNKNKKKPKNQNKTKKNKKQKQQQQQTGL